MTPRSRSGGAFLLVTILAWAWFAGGPAYGQPAKQPQELPETKVTAPRPAAPEPPPPTPEPVPESRPSEISGRTTPVTNDIGSPQSASQGVVSQANIRDQPLLRTTSFLELIPGLIFANETNGIDAATMFLRGFNLDHGTDFAFFIDGVPINLGSNPHAQGYTDLNGVIPELVSTVDFGKGPYYAKVGNFSSVGYANIQYYDELSCGIAKIEAGKWDWYRTVVANSGHVGPGVLLYAVQFNYFNNAYQVDENLNKTSAIFRYTLGDDCTKVTLSAQLYNGQGTSEPIVPLRLVQGGFIDRFANLSPTDFIVANRYILNGQFSHRWENDAVTQGNVYGYRFTLSLSENSSGFVEDPVNGDQVHQIDRRWVAGANVAHSWYSPNFGECSRHTLGVQFRHDDIPSANTLATLNRVVVLDTLFSASIQESDTGLYYQNELKWTDKVRTVVGLRGDFYDVEVTDHLTPDNSGSKSAGIFLPKGSLILGPWADTEFFLNGGYSFHSNNANGAVVNIDPATGEPVTKVPLLVQARGAELGFRSQAIPNLTTSFALWQMHLQSELEFDPTSETTEPLRSSDRYGIEWTNTYRINKWFTLDADYSWSHGRLLGIDPDVPGQHIPNAVTTVFSGGPTVRLDNGLFAILRYRYWGPRYLNEEGNAHSRATNLFELSTGIDRPNYTVALQLFNLFNSKGHDIDFFDETFYPNFGDVAPVDDILFKPLNPFAARISVTMRW